MRVVRTALYAILILLAAGFALVRFLHTSRIGEYPRASFEGALSGHAYRPYAYRALMPLAANLLAPMLDAHAARGLGIASETVLGKRFFRDRLDGSAHPSQAIIILVLMYLSLVAFAATLHVFVRDLGYSSLIQYLLPVVLLLVCPLFFLGFGYMYDFPLLFLFLLSLYLMYRQQWGWYLLILGLGTLNKETTIFLFPVFALYAFHRMPRRKFLVLSAAQLGLYALIQGIIRYVFRLNPGGVTEWHFDDQVAQLTILAAERPWLLLYWGAACALLAGLVWHGWSRKPVIFRLALCILPAFLLLYVFWGYPFELRAMLEDYPILAILLLPPPPAPKGARERSTA
jgi:hypothetical protein